MDFMRTVEIKVPESRFEAFMTALERMIKVSEEAYESLMLLGVRERA